MKFGGLKRGSVLIVGTSLVAELIVLILEILKKEFQITIDLKQKLACYQLLQSIYL